MKPEHLLTPHAKMNSKRMKDLNVRPETTKLLRENMGRALFHINHRSFSLDQLGAKETNAKTNGI